MVRIRPQTTQAQKDIYQASLNIIPSIFVSLYSMQEVFNNNNQVSYEDSNIITLEWQEHIRRRPGMYIGKLGDGSASDDGIYVLLKEVLDNSIDEYMMGYGKTIEVKINEEIGRASCRERV